MRVTKMTVIRGLVSMIAVGAMGGSAAAENDALRLAALVPTGQALLSTQAEVVVATPSQGQVLVVDSMGNTRVLAGTGATGFAGDGGRASAARLSSPTSLGIDLVGNIYVADTGNNRIRRIDVAGIITTVAGMGEAGFDGDGVAALSARMNGPTALAFDTVRGRLLIADTGNHIVRSLEADGTLWTVAGSGRPGFAGDGGPATDARLLAPTGVNVDPWGHIYIADTGNHRVRRINMDGSIESVDTTVQTPLRAELAAPVPVGKRITVTSPGSDTSWQADSTRPIRWTHNLGAGAHFAVDLSRDGGLTWTLIKNVTAQSSTVSVSWHVTGPWTPTAMFRVRTTSGPKLFALSPTFAIQTLE